jgi:uncharacterized membrane protein
MLTAAALIVFIVELRFPDIIPIPGVKLGLANIFTVYAVYRFKAKEVFLMVLTRVILGSVFSSNLSALLYSFAGAMACLAGILVVVSYNMSEWRSFKAILKNPKSDIIVLLVTFFLTVIFDLTIAIEVGVLIACLLCMKRMAETTNVSVLSDEIDPMADTDVQGNLEHLVIPEGVKVYEINGPYFFGIGNKFEEMMGDMGLELDSISRM